MGKICGGAMRRKKPLVGVTGIIGSGKSTVSRMFAELGAAVFDADQVAREVTGERDVLEEIARNFGADLIDARGQLNRQALADRVFTDPARLRVLNAIVHPRVRERMWQFVKKKQADPNVVMILIDAPLIYETDLHKHLDFVIVVAADEETCIRRTMKRSNLNQKKIVERIRNQIPLSEKIKRADFVIDNNGDLAALKNQVEKVFQEIITHWQEQ